MNIQTRLTRGQLTFLAVAALFLIVMIGGEAGLRSGPPSAADDHTNLGLYACHFAQTAVKARLKAPTTAKFPGCVLGIHEYEIRADKEMKNVSIIGHVDAQNGFGAQIRSRFVVIADTNGSPQDSKLWTLQNAAIE